MVRQVKRCGAPSSSLKVKAQLGESVSNVERRWYSGRRGPVVVQIPRDLFNEDIDVEIPPAGSRTALAGGAVDRATLEKVRAMLMSARAPIIHAGAGIKWSRATAPLLALAEKLQLPLTMSAAHGDLAPVDHPLYAGTVGSYNFV